ncbi:5'-deoxynucleotidase [Ferrimonas lipolytica]|uniref:5'-deoxynucleotidase n=1 Tax=Ferrimonas lipolytica TaxID=2724191 RepID=A0A6H1UFB8_9GAMM|nr:5'-deoxynucleotidase [Ferrimonas lipolytica]QIZ77518.1 5'-deoxynucleotidase [Ferrimonas lipolytica]
MQPVFFALMSRMQNVHRWGKSNPTRAENVAEHSMQVAMFAHALGLIHNKIFPELKPVDENKLAVVALFHDAPEVLTEDVNSGIKYSAPRMLELCREMENIATELLVGTIPDPLKSSYAPLLSHGEGDLEAQIVKAADLLSAYTKALAELRAGNMEFEGTERKVLAALQPFIDDLPEVKWFMDNFVASFHLTIDDLVEAAFDSK